MCLSCHNIHITEHISEASSKNADFCPMIPASWLLLELVIIITLALRSEELSPTEYGMCLNNLLQGNTSFKYVEDFLHIALSKYCIQHISHP